MFLATIRDAVGQGNTALYVRARNSTGRYWNWTLSTWETAESDASKTFLTEFPSDVTESRYQAEITVPPGPSILEYVRVADLTAIGEEAVTGAPVVAPAPPPVSQPRPLVTQTQPDSMGEIPSAHLELNNFVQQVRSFLRDYPELNRLIKGEESSNRQIVWAILDALDDFNTTPPLITQFGLSNFPSKSLLIRATTKSLLESIGLLQTRNHIQFSDGGLTVGVNDKTQFIQSWIQIFQNSYEDKKLRLKTAINIESAWGGGVASEFRFVNNFYGEW